MSSFSLLFCFLVEEGGWLGLSHPVEIGHVNQLVVVAEPSVSNLTNIACNKLSLEAFLPI